MKSIHPHILKLALVAMLGSFASASAMAAEEASNFKTYDSNGDSTISLAEFMAQGGREEMFLAIDADGSRSLNSDEFSKIGTPKEPKAKSY
jgi:Ca2+-binding EF-hand superfamily protein